MDPKFHSNFSSCSAAVEQAFSANLDAQHTSTLHLAALLERGIKVLSYVGDYDFICNWVGNERWILDLEWTRQKEFSDQSLRNWTIGGSPVGVTRSGGGLTYATIHGAGHMVISHFHDIWVRKLTDFVCSATRRHMISPRKHGC